MLTLLRGLELPQDDNVSERSTNQLQSVFKKKVSNLMELINF